MPPVGQQPDSVVEVVREREALEELIRSDGWRTFTARTLREHQGRGYVSRMQTALAGPDPGTAAKVVDRAASDILRVLQWPTDRVSELRGVTEE
jgi:hypothetical protein